MMVKSMKENLDFTQKLEVLPVFFVHFSKRGNLRN